MQASALGSPAPSPDTLNMIRNPNAQTPANGQASDAQQTPQEGQGTQQSQSPGQSAAPEQGQPTVQLPQQPAVQFPQGVQSAPAELLPELPSVELPPLMELSPPRQDGNFQAFLQKLADTPSFPEALNRLLLSFVPAEGGKEVPQELEALMQQLPKDETQAAALLKQQISGGSKFTGELFDILRDAYAQAPTKTAKTEILQFVRRFHDYTSAGHIERSMTRTLEQLTKASPKEYSEELEALTAQLGEKLSEGDRGGALKLLQNKLLPFLTDISERHPDMRLPNTLISIFKPLAARYENSSEDGLLQAFRQLAEQTVLKPRLGKLDDGAFLKMVKESDFARADEQKEFAEQLARTADWAMKGKGGGEPRKLFRQVVNNMLLNKSVYLPLEHAVLPMEWNGKQLVAELWVDPDADQSRHREQGDDRLIRFVLHMDIPSLGPVDLALANSGEEVDVQLACPASVVPFSQMIEGEIKRIMENNGLTLAGVRVRKWERPLTLSSAFPKLAKGGSGVNMKI